MSDADLDLERVDGRRRRRERGRLAVIDAAIDLILEQGVPPSADAVSARSGVSQASLFRYFATLDELRTTAITRYFERFDDLIAIPSIGEGALGDRVSRFVEARDLLYARTAPMARLTRRQSADVPEFEETIGRFRSTLADQVHQHFAPELARTDSPTREEMVAVIAALTSFESWDQLAGLGVEGRRAALRTAVAALVAPTRQRS